MTSAFAFLTIFGRGGRPAPGAYAWFPVVGLAVGLITSGVYVGAAGVFRSNYQIAALAAVVTRVVVSGGLHLDALADSADGLCAAVDRERRLEIMKDSHVGTFGVIALVLVLGAQVSAFASFGGSRESVVVITLAAILGRWTMTVGALGHYARPGGLGAVFAEGGRTPIYVASVLTAIAVTAVAATGGLRIAVTLTVAAAVAAIVVHGFAWLRIRGYTGDTLGAAGELAETACLVLANAGGLG